MPDGSELARIRKGSVVARCLPGGIETNKEKPRYMCRPTFEPVAQEHKPEAIPFGQKRHSRCDAVSTTSDPFEASGEFRSG